MGSYFRIVVNWQVLWSNVRSCAFDISGWFSCVHRSSPDSVVLESKFLDLFPMRMKPYNIAIQDVSNLQAELQNEGTSLRSKEDIAKEFASMAQ
jgi:hypothetical protein